VRRAAACAGAELAAVGIGSSPEVPSEPVTYRTDGASEFETLYEQHLKVPLGLDVVSLVDFWHAAEYLGAAARADGR
jgi:hypothetical protein